MSARRYVASCAVAAAVTVAAMLAWTGYRIRETGRAHRRARGMR